jgi:hypothetical protein
MALPLLTDAIDPIEIPPIEGFVLNVLAIQGDMIRDGTPYHDFMAIYANLDLAPPATPGRQTRARIAEVRVPDLELMSIRRPGGPMVPEVIVEVDTESGQAAEYSYRIDDGFWRPFSRSRRLTVHDSRLLLVGQHTLEVRARTPGDTRSLDPTPVRLAFDIQPPGKAFGSFELPELDWHATLQTPEGSAPLLLDDAEIPKEEQGCACTTEAPGCSVPCLLLALIPFLFRRRTS